MFRALKHRGPIPGAGTCCCWKMVAAVMSGDSWSRVGTILNWEHSIKDTH